VLAVGHSVLVALYQMLARWEPYHALGARLRRQLRQHERSKKGGVTPVGIYPTGASPYHALDMAGNVWEWVSSRYYPYPYNGVDGREQAEPALSRVLRGGSWYSGADAARAACRGHFPGERGGGTAGSA